MFNPVIAAMIAASSFIAPASIGPVETHEQAVSMCNASYDDPRECVAAAINTDWAPASTTFVLHTLATNPAIVTAVADTDRELRDSALAFDTTYEYERDILVCELAFPTMFDENDDRYLLDPTVFALDACFSDTISNHGMTE